MSQKTTSHEKESREKDAPSVTHPDEAKQPSMWGRLVKIVGSLVIAGVLLWLSLRGIDLQEFWQQLQRVPLGWIWIFIPVAILSHLFRALRWRLLIEKEGSQAKTSTLFAGVMLGYFMNFLVPRLGEITRPVYVARKIHASSSWMIGTIVLERIIDLLILIGLFFFVILALLSDSSVVTDLLGTDEVPTALLLGIVAGALLVLGLIWISLKGIMASRDRLPGPMLKTWPQFTGYTILTWLGYIAMSYLPFFAIETVQPGVTLGFTEAIVITVVAGIGITIPTPGGIGTYHLFVQQALFLLYGVPLVEGLAYATLSHGLGMIVILASTPILLWFDKNFTKDAL
jgi:uncharacterized membrane protein YbhN (UPF0104 family)